MSTAVSNIDHLHKAELAADTLRKATGVDRVDLALTLGSGWKQAAEQIGEVVSEIPAQKVPGFRPPALAGHGGSLRVLRTPEHKHVLVIGARTHLYEGHGTAAVAHGMRTAAAFGAGTVLLTNGAGSTRTDWQPGTAVLLSDHINLTGTSPLDGAAFIDMSEVYSSSLRALAKQVDPTLPEGVYAQFRGPQYETPAEIRMARTIGADLVGMSTAIEVIAAREANLDVLALSLVTNLAAGIQGTKLNHEEVLATGQASEVRLARLLSRVVHTILDSSAR